MNMKSSLKAIALSASFIALTASPALANKTTETKAAAYKIDAKNSVVKWMGKKSIVDSSHNGTIPVKSGEITVDGNTLKGGMVEVDMTNLANDDLKADAKMQGKLIGHLKSDDFFSVAKHPTATFKVKSVKPIKAAKGNQPNHEITGDMTIKGITNEVTFPAIVRFLDNGAEATGKMVLDRTKWDVRYGSGKFFENLGDKMIADNIELDLKLIATK